MQRRRLAGLVMVVVVATGFGDRAVSPPPLHAQESRPARLAGTVVDGTSREPIAGSRVRLLREYREQASTVADAEGRFAFENVPPGFYSVSATQSDYIAVFQDGGLRSSLTIELAPGEPVTNVALALGRRPSISGTIRDEAGDPVIGAEVRALLRNGQGAGALDSLGLARTDDRGAYRISLYRPGDYLVVAMRAPAPFTPRTVARAAPTVLYPPVFYPASARPSGAAVLTIGVGEERGGIDVSLTPVSGRTLSGTIGGEPVTGRLIDVNLVPVDGAEVQWDLSMASVRVPIGGRFSFSGVPPGRYLLSGVSFPFNAGRGTRVLQQNPWSSGFGMTGLRPGEPTGPPPTGPTFWGEAHVTVGDIDVTDLEVSLHQGARLRGRVVFEGEAAPPTEPELTSAWVLVMSAERRLLNAMPISGPDAGGRFETVGLPPGGYRIGVVFETPVWRTRSMTLAGEDVIGRPILLGSTDIDDVIQTYSDRRTNVSGLVTDRSGRPVAQAMVRIFPVDRQLWGRDEAAGATAETSQRGTFQTRWSRDAGEYFVAVVPATLRNRMDAAALDELSRSATRVRLELGQDRQVTVTAGAEP